MSDNLSFGLEGKIVLLTGATGAIGGAVAKGFADAGSKVAGGRHRSSPMR